MSLYIKILTDTARNKHLIYIVAFWGMTSCSLIGQLKATLNICNPEYHNPNFHCPENFKYQTQCFHYLPPCHYIMIAWCIKLTVLQGSPYKILPHKNSAGIPNSCTANYTPIPSWRLWDNCNYNNFHLHKSLRSPLFSIIVAALHSCSSLNILLLCFVFTYFVCILKAGDYVSEPVMFSIFLLFVCRETVLMVSSVNMENRSAGVT
jgi:hypothetical protein